MKIRSDFVSNSSSSSFVISAEDNYHMMVLNNPEIMTFREYFDKFAEREFSNIIHSLSWLALDIDTVTNYISDTEFVLQFILRNDAIDTSINTEYKYKVPLVDIPIGAKQEYLQYMYFNSMNRSKPSHIDDTDLDDQQFDDRECLDIYFRRRFLEKLYDILEPTYGSMKLCYQEIDDNYLICNENIGDIWKYNIESDKALIIDDESNISGSTITKTDITNARKSEFFYESKHISNNIELVTERIKFVNAHIKTIKFCRIFSNH